MKLMVAYNGSAESYSALALAKKHAENFNAELIVMSSSEGGSSEKPEKILKIKEKLNEIKNDATTNGIKCEVFQMVRGLSPGEDVVLFADEYQIDMIYAGIEKKSKTTKLFLGSTAQYIILKAPCPVITVKI